MHYAKSNSSIITLTLRFITLLKLLFGQLLKASETNGGNVEIKSAKLIHHNIEILILQLHSYNIMQ